MNSNCISFFIVYNLCTSGTDYYAFMLILGRFLDLDDVVQTNVKIALYNGTLYHKHLQTILVDILLSPIGLCES